MSVGRRIVEQTLTSRKHENAEDKRCRGEHLDKESLSSRSSGAKSDVNSQFPGCQAIEDRRRNDRADILGDGYDYNSRVSSIRRIGGGHIRTKRSGFTAPTMQRASETFGLKIEPVNR